jgi:very-short-patch-repair endonuclease
MKRKASKTKQVKSEPIAVQILDRQTGKVWTAEHRFDSVRQWRFDYACIGAKIAIEVEGGVWKKGRHTRGDGFIEDMKKYNRATSLGWRVLRYTPDQFNGMSWLSDLAGMF